MKLENERLYLEADNKGAEVHHLIDKQTNIEYIWQRDPQYWANCNPILFPVIGHSYNNEYLFGDQVTTMANHGFLRYAPFAQMHPQENTIGYQFSADAQTLSQYPFDFTLQVYYTLEADGYLVEYRIINKSEKTMPFNFGLHPAFRVPLMEGQSFDDYSLTFTNKENQKGFGEFTRIPLSYDLFEQKHTLVFNNLNSIAIGISDGSHGVWVSTVGWPVVAVWTKQAGAPFVCLEPWLKRGERVEELLPFEKRDAAILLPKGKQYSLSYRVRVY